MFSKYFFAAALGALTPVLAGAATETSLTGITGGSAPISVMQPYLELTPLVRVRSDEFSNVGEVKWFAGNFAPQGYALANGAVLDIATNQALFSKVGTTYGGDGRTTFALPDLRGRAVLGAGATVQMGRLYGSETVVMTEANLPAHSHITHDVLTTTTTGGNAPIDIRMPSLALQYKLNTQGIFPSRSSLEDSSNASSGASQTLAFLSIDAAVNDNDQGTLDAEGQILSIQNNSALFSLMGTTYGGDGRTTFGAPDTVDRLVVGAGSGPGLLPRRLGDASGSDTVELTSNQMPVHLHTDGSELTSSAGALQAVSLTEEEIALNFVIALQGTFPSRDSGGSSSASSEPFIGEIGLFAGNFAPRGWALAHGQLLPISQFQSLFSILGTQFGGDGRTTFALPDLRGRTPIGSTDFWNGARGGSDSVVLSTTQMAAHSHEITREIAQPVPLPAGMVLLVSGLFAAFGLRRRATA